MSAKKMNAYIGKMTPELEKLLNDFELDDYETRCRMRGSERLYLRLHRASTPIKICVKK